MHNNLICETSCSCMSAQQHAPPVGGASGEQVRHRPGRAPEGLPPALAQAVKLTPEEGGKRRRRRTRKQGRRAAKAASKAKKKIGRSPASERRGKRKAAASQPSTKEVGRPLCPLL